MPAMTDAQIEEFLEPTRQGILLRTTRDGTATGAPVWFDWDGVAVRCFSDASAPKVRSIGRDPRISLLVVNELDEAPAWVRFDGAAVLDHDGDVNRFAADVLAPRYWDLSKPELAATVDAWRAAPPGALVMIELRPERIRSSTG